VSSSSNKSIIAGMRTNKRLKIFFHMIILFLMINNAANIHHIMAFGAFLRIFNIGSTSEAAWNYFVAYRKEKP
jgi:hypothetical protein